ncbi:MAG: hypothetical protein ACYTXY_51275, partial [Nostoc sp.]
MFNSVMQIRCFSAYNQVVSKKTFYRVGHLDGSTILLCFDVSQRYCPSFVFRTSRTRFIFTR